MLSAGASDRTHRLLTLSTLCWHGQSPDSRDMLRAGPDHAKRCHAPKDMGMFRLGAISKTQSLWRKRKKN